MVITVWNIVCVLRFIAGGGLTAYIIAGAWNICVKERIIIAGVATMLVLFLFSERAKRAKLTISRVQLRFQIYIYIYVGMYAYVKKFRPRF